MSLLQKASIITTPTAYAEDYLYSIKPAYALGENLVSNGGFDTDTDWSKTTGWTISGGKANWNPAVAPYNNDIYRAFSFVEGTRYRITFTMSNNTTGRILLRLSGTGNQDVNGNYIYYANGTHTVEFKAQANKNFLRIYGHDSYSSFSIDDFSLKIITDADFDFDRNSTGTRVNEDYLIEDVPYNLITYSEDFSVWSKEATVTLTANYALAPDGTQTSTRMQMDANDSIFRSVSSGNTFSVHIKGAEGETIRLANGGSLTHTLTGRWDRISLYDTGNISSLITINTYSSATARDIQIWGAQVVKGDQPKDYLKTTDRLDIPRIDYTNGEPSILLEPQRTNTVTYSQDFSQYFSGSLTLTTGFLAPDGTNSATKVTATIGAASLYRSGESSTTASRTIWARTVSGTGTAGLLSYFGNTDNLFTITEKWQRFEVNSAVATGGTNFYAIDFRDTSQTLSEIIVWGAQSEVGSYATSLIHTSGSAVTRSADAANNAGNSDLINSTEGVLYAEIKASANDSTYKQIGIGNGVSGNEINISYDSTANRISCVYRVSNSYLINFFIDGNVNTEYNKIAFKYKANDFTLSLNGQQQLVNTTNSTMISGLNNLKFASGSGGANFYGNAKMVAVFKEALTDLKLEKQTGNNHHELCTNHSNRLSYLGLVEEYNVESDINNYIL